MGWIDHAIEAREGRPGWRFAADLWVWMCRHKRSAAALTALEALLVVVIIVSAIRGRLAPAMGALIMLCLIWTFGLLWPGRAASHRQGE